MNGVLEVLEDGRPLRFAHAELLRYHGGRSPGGVAHAFKVMERAFALLAVARPPERREITVETAFGGPGARDGFEVVTRSVTGGRYHVRPELARPERGPTLERFVFRLAYRGRRVELAVCDGFVSDELITLVRGSRNRAQEARLTVLKRAMAEHVMSRPAAEVYDAATAIDGAPGPDAPEPGARPT